MKNFDKIGGALVSVAFLLTMSTIKPFAISWDIDPILAQTAPNNTESPADTSTSVRTTQSNEPLWLWLLTIPVGVLLWALWRSRPKPVLESGAADRIIAPAPSAPIAPVAASDSTLEIEHREAPALAGNSHQRSDAIGERVEDEKIRLLEERLVVDVHKRKIGEVVVRKEVETRIVRVPVRREILIVEQISPEFKQLAVVDLGQIEDTEITSEAGTEILPTVMDRK